MKIADTVTLAFDTMFDAFVSGRCARVRKQSAVTAIGVDVQHGFVEMIFGSGKVAGG